MSEHSKVIHPEDLIAPEGPHDLHPGLNVRTKASGVVRFSKRAQYAMWGALAVVVLGLGYGLGIFEGPKTSASQLPAQPQATKAPEQAVSTSDNSAIDELTKNAPRALPNPSRLSAHDTRGSALAGQMVSPSPAAMPVDTAVNPPVAVAPPPQTRAVAYDAPQSVPNPGSVTEALTQNASGLFQGGSRNGSDEQKTLQDARHATFFVGGGNRGEQNGATQQVVAQDVPGPNPTASPQNESVAGQAQRIAFANGDSQRPPYLPSVQSDPAGKVELWAGSTIGAELDTGINTDLPGPVVAHVTHDVFDSKSGTTLVVPKGARLVGRYNSVVTHGQARVQVVWDRLIWPDGRYLNLLAMPSGDTTGNAGMYADVNDHRGGIIGATLLSGLFGAAVNLLQQSGNSTNYVVNSAGQVVTNSVGTEIAKTGQQIVQQKMQAPPELTVPAGENFNVILDRSILLSPWEYHQ